MEKLSRWEHDSQGFYFCPDCGAPNDWYGKPNTCLGSVTDPADYSFDYCPRCGATMFVYISSKKEIHDDCSGTR